MTQEEKQLLLTDLCARLPYGVKANIRYCDLQDDEKIKYRDIDITYFNIEQVVNNWSECKPYLRPMNSVTAEERDEIEVFICDDWFIDDDKATKVDSEGFIEFLSNYDCSGIYPEFCGQYVDWLLSHHFDYRGLIEKGLALEAPADMYKTK